MILHEFYIPVLSLNLSKFYMGPLINLRNIEPRKFNANVLLSR